MFWIRPWKPEAVSNGALNVSCEETVNFASSAKIRDTSVLHYLWKNKWAWTLLGGSHPQVFEMVTINGCKSTNATVYFTTVSMPDFQGNVSFSLMKTM